MTLDDLLELIEIEKDNILFTLSNIDELREIFGQKEPDKFQLAALSKLMSDLYNGTENILKQVCKFNNYKIPSGAFYHTELLLLFSNKPDINLPTFIDCLIFEDFKALLKFRHYVIHGYAFQLKWSFIEPSVLKLRFMTEHFLKNVEKYLQDLPQSYLK